MAGREVAPAAPIPTRAGRTHQPKWFAFFLRASPPGTDYPHKHFAIKSGIRQCIGWPPGGCHAITGGGPPSPSYLGGCPSGLIIQNPVLIALQERQIDDEVAGDVVDLIATVYPYTDLTHVLTISWK